MECDFCGESFHPINQFNRALLHYLDHLTSLLNEIRANQEELR